jgi:hypothetical protein
VSAQVIAEAIQKCSDELRLCAASASVIMFEAIWHVLQNSAIRPFRRPVQKPNCGGGVAVEHADV